jgi:hypothetical protein
MITYRLLSKNCYWYSGLLLNLLEMKHGLKAATKGGRHGTWKRYVCLYQQAEEAELRPIIDTFHFDLEAFEKTVSIPFLSIPKTMAHFLLRLRRKREDSQKIKKGLETQRKGEKRRNPRARDEARRREEAESRARDEARGREEAESRARDEARGKEEAARGKEEAESRARDAEEELRRLRSVLKKQGISYNVSRYFQGIL